MQPSAIVKHPSGDLGVHALLNAVAVSKNEPGLSPDLHQMGMLCSALALRNQKHATNFLAIAL